MSGFPGEELASSIVAGGINYAGQHSANQTNKDLAEDNRRFQADMSREMAVFNRDNMREANAVARINMGDQMDFQREMSNTAYQRATVDMRAAGINPMAAYQLGGASTPSGAGAGTHTASGSAPSGGAATVENELSGALGSALATRELKKNIELAGSQVTLQNAQKEATDAAAAVSRTTAKQANMQNDAVKAEASARIKTAKTAESFAEANAYADVIGKALGAAGSAVGAAAGLKYIFKDPGNGVKINDKTYKQQDAERRKSMGLPPLR